MENLTGFLNKRPPWRLRWGYKFSWSPRGVLVASQNSARFKDGVLVRRKMPDGQMISVIFEIGIDPIEITAWTHGLVIGKYTPIGVGFKKKIILPLFCGEMIQFDYIIIFRGNHQLDPRFFRGACPILVVFVQDVSKKKLNNEIVYPWNEQIFLPLEMDGKIPILSEFEVLAKSGAKKPLLPKKLRCPLKITGWKMYFLLN